jgi:hypothetical protein
MSSASKPALDPQHNNSAKGKDFVRPCSGDLGSFAVGGITAFACLIAFGKLTISTDLSANRDKQMKFMRETQVSWSPPPTLPINFDNKRFVEANSEAPENPPDETSNFSFRDQQAAQPKQSNTLSTDNIPEVKGEEETVKIASSQKQAKPSQVVPKNLKKETQQAAKNNLSPEKTVPSKTDLPEGKSEEGIQLKKNEDNGDSKKRILLAKSTPNTLANRSEPVLSQPRQKPRPKLSPDLIRGPLMKSSTTAHRIGTVAIECRLHPYGVYLQEMLKSIEEQWHQLASGSLQFLQKDRLPGIVTFRFTLLPTGRIEKLSRLDNGESSLPAELCRQAIASRVPFGSWTEEMIKDFGKSDDVTISFRYQ